MACKRKKKVDFKEIETLVNRINAREHEIEQHIETLFQFMIEGESYDVDTGIKGMSQTSSNRINRQRLNFIKRLADVANEFYVRDTTYLIKVYSQLYLELEKSEYMKKIERYTSKHFAKCKLHAVASIVDIEMYVIYIRYEKWWTYIMECE